jgi:thioredoxin reductase/polyferredoxin
VLPNVRAKLEAILTSGSRDHPRPIVSKTFESNVKGLYIIGDLAGAPVIKLAMAQGVEVIEMLAERSDMARPAEGDLLDVLIIGAGAAGLNAALAAKDRAWRAVVLEKGKLANTIENFPEGKWIYAEPDSKPAKGKLWLDGASKEELVSRWHQIVKDNNLDIRVEEPLTRLERQADGTFLAHTPVGVHHAKKIILATGQRGNPRKLGIAGEELEQVYHRLYSPRQYTNEDLLVVGGGNSAVEAALTLAEHNRVTLSYRGGEFARLFKDNRRLIDQAIADDKVKVLFNSKPQAFRSVHSGLVAGLEVDLEVDHGGNQENQTLSLQHAFVLIGADLPVAFLKSLGIRLENEWSGSLLRSAALTLLSLAGLWCFGPQLGGPTPAWSLLEGIPPMAGGLGALLGLGLLFNFALRGDRWAWLGLSFFAWYSIYGIKRGTGAEFWPYRGWGHDSLSFFQRPWSFWYTVLYTGLMTVFGLQALKRWGLERKDRFQIWRFTSLLTFQWIFFFLLPEFLFQWAIKYQWVGEQLASDPQFAEQAWRTYGAVYAWPLFFYTWLYDPHMIWVVWGILLTFLVIPIFAIFHGKRYCSWICGCGGLAETFGDRWRHLAPKGKTALRWEKMGLWIFLFAAVATLLMLFKDAFGWYNAADRSVKIYGLLVDVWLVGILPVTVYPFMGGKVWCRFWCPLAKMMEWTSRIYVKLGISRFHIVSNDKCIACNECSRNCQVGIDVMQYALKQEPLDNATSSCIGCGICVTVCPMDTLSYSKTGESPLKIVS